MDTHFPNVGQAQPNDSASGQTAMLLERLIHVEEISQAQIKELKSQNEVLIGILNSIRENIADASEESRVYVQDIDMSVSSMFVFMFKWLVASIPVGIIVGMIWLILSVIFFGLSTGLFR